MIYNIFISHSWEYGDQYERLVKLLDSCINKINAEKEKSIAVNIPAIIVIISSLIGYLIGNSLTNTIISLIVIIAYIFICVFLVVIKASQIINIKNKQLELYNYIKLILEKG